MKTDILNRIKALMRSKDTCVLATSAGDMPHCSLMVYATDDPCREIYMVTYREGTKYANLKQNPNVSLLIDTREDHPGVNRSKAMALTVNGRFQEIEEPARKTKITQWLRERHPHIEDFVTDVQAAIFVVKISSFLLLDGLTDSHYLSIDAP